jgi:cobalt-zinc-cadmium resistance protein CzcA
VIKNGTTEAVGGVVMMIAGGNAKEVVSRIKTRVEEINRKGMLPDGLKIAPYYDRSELVDAALWTVTKVLLEGVALVVIVLFLFLGDVRSSLIVVATLVLTPLLTFMAMNKLGISANLMSLGGLAIAIGLMVDGSVVVVENAFLQLGRHAKSGESQLRVILRAVVEVATPVIFGVGIIILVFLPLMTLQGMEGKMFAPLAYTIAIALAISLVLSMTLTPVMTTYLLKPPAHDGDHTRLIAAMKQRYLKMLHWALGNERKTVILAVGAFVLTIGTLPFLGTAFIPEMKEGSVVPGINRAQHLARRVDQDGNGRHAPGHAGAGVKSAVSGVGRGESPADPQGPNESTPIVSLKPRSEWPPGWTQEDIQDAMREKLKVLPGVQVVMAQPISDRVDEMVTGVRSDIAVKVFGDDLDQLRKIAGQIGKVAQTCRALRIYASSGSAGSSICPSILIGRPLRASD